MNPESRPYRGRFAPSPSGDLHYGSLVAALASYLEARHHKGRWLVRIEDIDPPREVAGSARRIIRDLQRLGMNPDGEVLFQSSRSAAYDGAVDRLLAQGDAYWCGCSRSDIPDSGVYPGTCRNGIPRGLKARSVRVRTDHGTVSFTDRIQGLVGQDVEHEVGDFIIRRADGLTAYQLAVVVDDAFQDIGEIVRGADLLESTPRQILLQRMLRLPTPRYAHVPLVQGSDGKKLSKRVASDPVSLQSPAAAVRQALRFLGHDPPACTSLGGIWKWALRHWDIDRVPRTLSLPMVPENQ